jgi:biotin transport system permease protein
VVRFESGDTIVHALDPRAKLAVQVSFAVAAFAHTTPRGLAVLSLLAFAILGVTGLSPLSVLRDVWIVLPLLVLAPVVEGAHLGAPWFVLADARYPALASYRVVLVLFVSAAYVHSTPTRSSRAAVKHLVPGRFGQLLGMGVAVVFRFVPVLIADLKRSREAMQARLGTERSLHERMQYVATSGLNRAFDRADALAVALQARCFAYNPTLPRLTFAARDWIAVAVAATLVASAIPI